MARSQAAPAPRPGAPAKGKPRRREGRALDHRQLPTLAPTTADLLAAFPRIFLQDPVRLRQLLRTLGDRGLASALLLLTLPQLLPMPLGLSNILALPIILVAAQMAIGRHVLWLPAWLLDRPIGRRWLLGACARAVPVLRRLEVVIRPRLRGIWAPPGDRVVGLSCTLIAAVSIAPLPLTGWLPALALVIVALGMLERDGLVVLAGLTVGAFAIAVFVAVVAGLVEAGERLKEMAALPVLV